MFVLLIYYVKFPPLCISTIPLLVSEVGIHAFLDLSIRWSLDDYICTQTPLATAPVVLVSE